MPTKRLIDRLSLLCEEYGARFHVTTEEYTSKASFIDNDELHQYGAKPIEWKPSGKRISRDVYRTKDGLLIHADLNAASNILRKVADQIFSNPGIAKLAFEIIKRSALTHPKRYDIFSNLKRSYRKQTTSRSVSLDHARSDNCLESQFFQSWEMSNPTSALLSNIFLVCKF